MLSIGGCLAEERNVEEKKGSIRAKYLCQISSRVTPVDLSLSSHNIHIH